MDQPYLHDLNACALQSVSCAYCTTIMFGCRLEVTLEKERGGLEWPSLREKEGEGAGREGMSELPLREPVLDQLSQEELEELKKKLADATKNEVK